MMFRYRFRPEVVGFPSEIVEKGKRAVQGYLRGKQGRSRTQVQQHHHDIC